MTGSTIKRLREAKGLSQQSLAVAAGLSSRTIQRLEHEKHPPLLATLQAVARGLEIPLDKLLAEARKDAEAASKEPAGEAVGS